MKRRRLRTVSTLRLYREAVVVTSVPGLPRRSSGVGFTSSEYPPRRASKRACAGHVAAMHQQQQQQQHIVRAFFLVLLLCLSVCVGEFPFIPPMARLSAGGRRITASRA